MIYYPDIPEGAISIMQPWTCLIVRGFKVIENRSRRTSYRGPIAIHAGKVCDDDALCDVLDGVHPVSGEPVSFGLAAGDMVRGGIVGIAEIVDCIDSSSDPYFVGPFGYVLRNARPVPFIPVRGAVNIPFRWRQYL